MTAFEINDVELPSLLQTTKIDAFVQELFSIKQLEHIIEKHS